MKNILNDKKFVNAEITVNGEVSGETIFHYKQHGTTIEGIYSGGNIRKGHVIGVMTGENTFTMLYHHINENNEIRLGECHTTIFIDSDHNVQLIESWELLNGDCSKGESLFVELKTRSGE